MNDIQRFLQSPIGKNTLQEYLQATFIITVTWFLLTFLKRFLATRFKKYSGQMLDAETSTFFERFFSSIKNSTFLLLGLLFSLPLFEINPKFEKFLQFFVLAGLALEVVRCLKKLAHFFLPKLLFKNRDQSPEAQNSVKLLLAVIQGMLWITAILFVLSNLGFNITSAIAGLGIGGVAVALAAQNLLGDVISSFVLLIGKHIEVGDYIVVGEDKGWVTEIGLKTTRLQSLEGETIILPNSELTRNRVRNFRYLPRKRIELRVRVAATTPVEKLRSVPELLKTSLNGMQNAEFEKVQLSQQSDFGFNYDLSFFAANPLEQQPQLLQSEVYCRAFEKLNQAGIQLGFAQNQPTEARS